MEGDNDRSIFLGPNWILSNVHFCTLAPWRLARVTVGQLSANLAGRQAAAAVRSRIDVKYLLGLDRTDPGFDFSVLQSKLVEKPMRRLSVKMAVISLI